jgi:hypothetical protein
MPSATPPTRWTFYDPALLYLFPLTYLVHLVEEWFAAAPIVLWGVRADPPVAAASFVAAHAAGIVLMVIGVRLVRRDSRYHWIAPALATAVLLNTAGHLVGTLASGSYSAGLLTGVVLWAPLGGLTLVRAWDQASARTLYAGIAVGVAVEVIVVSALRAIGA